MKKAKKILTLVACAVLLVCISVGATLAYLADTTEVVTNTFTVGDVSFAEVGLDEVKSNNLGVADTTEDRVDNNSYKLMPGITYAKDPTIHLDPASEPCYVRAMVTVTNFTDVAEVVKALNGDNDLTDEEVAAKMTDVVVGYDKDFWEDTAKTISFDAENDTVTYEFRVKAMVVPGNDKTFNGAAVAATTEKVSKFANSATDAYEINLFEEIVMPVNLTDEHLEALQEMQIKIEAHAIQAEGFADADAAWEAWNN